MAIDRGLPAVPQGLPRGLTVYLQNLHAYLLRLAGNVRGSAETQAVRRTELSGLSRNTTPSDNSITESMLREGTITENKLADGAVTGKKIADATIEGNKLVQGTIGSRELGTRAVDTGAIQDGAVTVGKLADGAVSSEKLEDGAVTADKLKKGLLTVTLSGEAEDGATVELAGDWAEWPSVYATGFTMPSFPAGASFTILATNVREEEGRLVFDATAKAVFPANEELGTEETIVHGKLHWLAVGRQ